MLDTVKVCEPACTLPEEPADISTSCMVTAEAPALIVYEPSIVYSPGEFDTGAIVCAWPFTMNVTSGVAWETSASLCDGAWVNWAVGSIVPACEVGGSSAVEYKTG